MAKILLIRLTSLGDVIFTFPLAHVLKRAGYEVDFLVSEKGYDIVNTNSDISKIYLVPLMRWKKEGFNFKEFINIVSLLRKEKYDIAMDCQQMFKSLFFFLFCGAKRRITFSDARELSILGGNEFIKPKKQFRDSTYHIVDRNLDFARYLDIKVDNVVFPSSNCGDEIKDKVDSLLQNLDVNKKTVVISPETTWENKHWNLKNWIELVDYLKDRVNIIFTGMDSNYISKISDYGLNLAGKTSLLELLEIFKRVDMVISPDSGSSNLAWYSSNPCVITIFTCTPSKRFGPFGNSGKYFSVQGNLHCQPCFKKKCILKTNMCVNVPNAGEIIKIVNELLF